MRSVIVRGLTRDFIVHSESEGVADGLDAISADPTISGFPRGSVELDVRLNAAGEPEVEIPDSGPYAGDVDHVVGRIYAHTIAVIGQDMPGMPMLHAALVNLGGRRMAFVANKGTGKTTLLCHLLSIGAACEGDENILVRDDDVIARPRLLHVKEGSLRRLPELSRRIEGGLAGGMIKRVTTPEIPEPIWLTNPRLFGGDWRIAPAPLDFLIFLEPNHAGESTISPMTSFDAFGALTGTTIFFGEQTASLARLWRLSKTCRAYRMRIGDLAQAQALLEALKH